MIFDRGVLDSRAFIPEHLWARGVAALNRELTGCTADGSKRPEGSISNEYLLKRYDADLTLTLALALALALTLTLTQVSAAVEAALRQLRALVEQRPPPPPRSKL